VDPFSHYQGSENASVPQSIPTYDGNNQPKHPSVIKFASWNGFTYWMAMAPYYEDPPIVASNSGISWVVLEGVTNLLTPPTTVTLTWSMWKIRMSCGYIALKQTTSKVRAYAS